MRTALLDTLIWVDDFRFSITGNVILKQFPAAFGRQAITQTPAHNFTAVYIDDGCRIHKSMLHWDISNIRAPDLIGMSYQKALE